MVKSKKEKDAVIEKSVEYLLQQKTVRLDAVLSAMPDKIFVIDSNGIFVDFYAGEVNGLQISPDKIKGASIFDVFGEKEAEKHLSIYRECIKDKTLKVVEYELAGKDERTYYYEARVVPLEERTVLAVVRDITVGKKREIALIENEKRFRDLSEMLPEAIFETDLRMNLTYANQKAYKLFGYKEADVRNGINVLSTVAPQDREKAKENTIKRLQGIKENYTEYSGLKRDGTQFPMLLQSSVIIRDGAPVGFRGVIVDLTLQKQTEEAIKRVEKLESIGLLAGGIAHDFNNLLGGIFGAIELADNELEKGDIKEAKNLLSSSLSVFARAKDLTRQLLTFSKGGVPSKEIGDLAKTIEESVKFTLSGSNIKPFFKFNKNLWVCEFDPNQIAQAIENITINAMHSMPEGGAIEVGADNINIEEPLAVSIDPGKYVKVYIKDNGTGIPEKFFKKIFDPFFTTKRTGSGLGLAVSWSIINKHGGIIDLESSVGKGSTFYLYLPVAEKTCVKPESEKIDFEGEHQKAKVLIMDDDYVIREITSKILKEAGYDVEKVENGEKALEVYKKHFNKKEPFDVVILDLTIPGGMGGKETIVKILEINPEALAIATSGYSEDPVMANPTKFGFCSGLTKPYLKKIFLETVEKAISGKYPA